MLRPWPAKSPPRRPVRSATAGWAWRSFPFAIRAACRPKSHRPVRALHAHRRTRRMVSHIPARVRTNWISTVFVLAVPLLLSPGAVASVAPLLLLGLLNSEENKHHGPGNVTREAL